MMMAESVEREIVHNFNHATYMFILLMIGTYEGKDYIKNH